MDRKIAYDGEVPLVDDFLLTNKFAMIGLGMLAKAILGTSTWFDGLACTPTSPASMQVKVAPGAVYAFGNIDGTAYGDLGSDTTHQIVKQGIVLDNTLLSCPAPSTTGNSIVYLIQAALQDVDTDSAVLPYFDASNPPVAYAGPNNTGVSQNTTRKCECVLSVKAGTSATTGTQVAPSPDAGFTGLWTVTVANGATTIVSGNIALFAGSAAANGTSAAWSAPFITEKLNDKVSIATGDLRWAPLGGGSVRTRLTNNVTYHVAPTGNDSNDGSSGTPWLTKDHAYKWVQDNIDLAGFSVSVSVANSTGGGYTDGVNAFGPLVGNTQGAAGFTFVGNTGTPASCLINTASTNCFSGQQGAVFAVNGFKVQSGGSGVQGSGLYAAVNSYISYQNIEFGVCGSAHMYASTGATIQQAGGNIAISGGAVDHMHCETAALIQESGITATLTGTPAFSGAFATAIDGNIQSVLTTYTGSATGVRYAASLNGVINTIGGGASYFPGNAGGTTASGGEYA